MWRARHLVRLRLRNRFSRRKLPRWAFVFFLLLGCCGRPSVFSFWQIFRRVVAAEGEMPVQERSKGTAAGAHAVVPATTAPQEKIVADENAARKAAGRYRECQWRIEEAKRTKAARKDMFVNGQWARGRWMSHNETRSGACISRCSRCSSS